MPGRAGTPRGYGGGISNLKNINGQGHMLAYITPDEANSLQNMGGQKVMTPEGIPAYPPQENYSGPSYGGSSSSSGPAGGASSGGNYGGNGGGGYRDHERHAQAVVDAAINQAIANEALNTDLEGINISPITTSSQFSSPVSDDDIDALYSASGADFTPTDTRTIADKARDFYQKVSPLGIATNLLTKTPNQYEGITGEDALGGGDYVEDVQDFSQRVFNTDYTTLDNCLLYTSDAADE